MEFISDILVSSIQSPELNDHCTHVVGIVQKANITDPNLSGFTETLQAYNISLTEALNEERKNEFTDILFTLDGRRDNNYRCLKGHVLADAFNEDELIFAASKRIQRILKNHGLRLYSKSYEKESALLNALFMDLDKEPTQADLLLLGLSEKYAALKNAQSAFSTTYEERSTNASTKDTVIPAYIAQKDVKNSLELVTDYVNALANAGNEPFENLAKAIDDLVDNLNTKIRTRIAVNSKKDETGEKNA